MGVKLRIIKKIRSLRSRGYLTRKQLEVLEEASQKPFKAKRPAQKYACGSCSYEWFYKSMKCPACSSEKISAA